MKSKKKLLEDSRLYVVIDRKVCAPKSPLNIANKIKNSGVDIIQFRDKLSDKEAVFGDAQSMRDLLLNSKSLFIINDFVDIAKILDIDGVHLGGGDTSIGLARKILGKDKIIGISCHSLKHAIDAQAQGADYISIGPVFATPTKPQAKPTGTELIERVRKKINIPFFVIGGINAGNISAVLSRGAKRVAVSRAVCKAKDASVAGKNLSLRLLD